MILMGGLTGTYQIREIDYLQDDATNWTAAGTITLEHQSTVIADSEANYEMSFKCLKITVPAGNINNKVTLASASWGDTTPALSTTPQIGYWIRSDTTGASVCQSIYSTSGTEVTTTPTIATANKWQFVRASLATATGTVDGFEIQVLTDSACVIYISRVWYVNDTRLLTGAGTLVGGTWTDEVISFGASVFNYSTNWSASRCLLYQNNAGLIYILPNTGYTQAIYGCFVDAATTGYILYGTGTSAGTHIISNSTENLFTGETNTISYQKINIEKSVNLLNSNSKIEYVKVFNTTAGVITSTSSIAISNWDNFHDITVYGATTGIGASTVVIYGMEWRLKNIRIIGGGTAFRYQLGALDLLDPYISVTNSPTTHLGGDYGTTKIREFRSTGSPNILTNKIYGWTAAFERFAEYGLQVYNAGYFITNPVTANIRVVPENSVANIFTGFYDTGVGATTDANGKATVYCLSTINYGANLQTQLDMTSEANPTNIYFIDYANNQSTREQYDMSTVQGSTVSPISINLPVSTTYVRFDSEAF